MNRKFMDWLRWQMASPDERERITRQRETVARIGAILKRTFGPRSL